jgi:hypothetical protein
MSEMEEYLAALRRYHAIQVDSVKQLLLEGYSIEKILKSSTISKQEIVEYIAKLKEQNEVALAEASRLQTILQEISHEIDAIKSSL